MFFKKNPKTFLLLKKIAFILGFSVLLRGIYYITPDFYSLSEKVAAALILTGECWVEAIADNNRKTMQDIPLDIFPST